LPVAYSAPRRVRLAWFSPLPPVRSGIAEVNRDLLPQLDGEFDIDRFDEPRAHDFVWNHRRRPYDLVVYQLGNASCHDYMWAYLARYPGLVVLHDPRLHHARARLLLNLRRFDDYRREFWYDHPDVIRDVVEYAVVGLGGPIYYLWPMLRLVMNTARTIAVHNGRVAGQLRQEYPRAAVETIRLGTAPLESSDAARASIRARFGIDDDGVLFSVFGKLTAEKRIAQIVRAFAAIVDDGSDVHLMLAGDASAYTSLDAELGSFGIGNRVHVTGYVDETDVGAYLSAADVCLCLRWPTALETSASWLQCLSARRPTLITDLAHLADVPESVALRVDLLDEEASLHRAMRRLAKDAGLREELSRGGRDHWAANHTVPLMAEDYRRVIANTLARTAPVPSDLPHHVTDDHTEPARAIARRFGITLEDVWSQFGVR
jgi:glycosyltransferase involved in cell wall biosynthesis